MSTGMSKVKQVLRFAAVSQEGRALLEDAMARVRNKQTDGFFVFPSSDHPAIQAVKEGGVDVVVVSGPDWAAIARPIVFPPEMKDLENRSTHVLMIYPDEESSQEETMQHAQDVLIDTDLIAAVCGCPACVSAATVR